MPDILTLKEWTIRTARLMVGIPDYQTYVEHRKSSSGTARTPVTRSARAGSAAAAESSCLRHFRLLTAAASLLARADEVIE